MLRRLNDRLPRLLDEIPVQYHADLFPLLAMDDQALQQELRQAFSPERWAMYETLLDRKKSAPLTNEEERELTDLRHEADIVMFRRTYAAVLLKQRGHALPAPSKMVCISSMR